MKAILVVLLVTFLLVFVGCNSVGPTDVEIKQAESYADSLPADHPDKPAAEAHVAELKAERARADNQASTLAGLLGIIAPGLGGAVGIVYGAIQRIRNARSQSALMATMVGIEEFKKLGGSDAVANLINGLAKSHDKAGVRDAVRAALAELRLKNA
jgi:hypothetical protein